MIKVNYCSMIFQKNFNRYSAELVRTRSASLRSASLRFAPLRSASLRYLSLRAGAYAPTLSGMVLQTAFPYAPLRLKQFFKRIKAVFQTAFLSLVKIAALRAGAFFKTPHPVGKAKLHNSCYNPTRWAPLRFGVPLCSTLVVITNIM